MILKEDFEDAEPQRDGFTITRRDLDNIVAAFAQANRKLEEKIDRLEAELKRLKATRPQVLETGSRDHILKEENGFIVGVTEYVNGVYSSVWMRAKP